MPKTIISDGQSLIDVAIQELGSADAAWALADANGLSITDALTPGQVLTLPAVATADVVSYFATRRQRINTGDQVATMPAPAIRDHHELDYDPRDYR